MGERGIIRRYSYWSERRIKSIAVDNGIALDPKARLTFKSPSIPLFPGLEIAKDTRALHRGDVSGRIEQAIGALAVEDFVTPTPVLFARGTGTIEYALFAGAQSNWQGIVAHTQVISSSGARVEIILFGSLEHLTEFAGASDNPPGGWISSSAHAIEEFLHSRVLDTTYWDDEEAFAIEALKLARNQGMIGHHDEHRGKPESRGHTLSRANRAEWYAEIYRDIPVDPKRWRDSYEVDRVLIGAPLWIRTPTEADIVRYRDLRR